jgi:hypothetical protein
MEPGASWGTQQETENREDLFLAYSPILKKKNKVCLSDLNAICVSVNPTY